MGCQGGSRAETDGQCPPESYYRELQAAGWVDGPSRVPEDTSGEHLAVIDQTDSDQRGFTAKFVRNGVANGSQCLYITTEDVASEWAGGESDSHGVPTAENVTVTTIGEWVPDIAVADAEELLGGVREATESVAGIDGRTKVVIDLAGLLDVIPFYELVTSERRLGEVCRATDAVILSRYRREQLSDAKLAELLTAHPYIVVEGTVCYNPQHRPPSNDVAGAQSDGVLDRKIGTLLDRTETRMELEKLKRENEQLRVFANSISHDLRNPLQTAIGRAELLPDDEKQVQVVREALERMETLIEDGLQMVEGADLTESETVSVRALTEQCWDMMNVADADLTVTDDFVVTGDTSRLQQLFENLFRNSVKYGGTAPSIRVGPVEQIHLATRADTDTGYSGFYVEDDGPGIPEDRQDEIFELGESGGDGTGYGLPIVKKIVEAHDWTIRVSSSSDGGARFEITGVDARPPGSGD